MPNYSPANRTLNLQISNTARPLGALQLYWPIDPGAKFENVRVLLIVDTWQLQTSSTSGRSSLMALASRYQSRALVDIVLCVQVRVRLPPLVIISGNSGPTWGFMLNSKCACVCVCVCVCVCEWVSEWVSVSVSESESESESERERERKRETSNWQLLQVKWGYLCVL